MIQLEICASTLVDVAVALEAGADRVELCSVWKVGGITPNVVVVESSVAMGMDVRALVRPREGHFCWSPSERTWSVEEARVLVEAGASHVVVGGLTPEHSLDMAYAQAMCDAVGSDRLVWHRAIDVSETPDRDIDCLLELGIVRVLSSGRHARAVDGLATLASWSARGMQVVAGGGVRPQDVAALASAGIEAVHASCRSSTTAASHPLFDGQTHPVDPDKVLDLGDAVDACNEAIDGDASNTNAPS